MLCEKAGYARSTFYSHFYQMKDVPYHFYKDDCIIKLTEKLISIRAQGGALEDTVPLITKAFIGYLIDEVETYKLLKRIDMDDVMLKVFEDFSKECYKIVYPNHQSFLNSISGKCIIKSQAQITKSVLDIWIHSGKQLNIEEMTSTYLKIVDGTFGLSENLNKTNL